MGKSERALTVIPKAATEGMPIAQTYVNFHERNCHMAKNALETRKFVGRRTFIGGSDARIIMGADEITLIRLWQEKRGEAEPEDLSRNLIVQLGAATEELNRSCERNTGRQVRDVQR